MNNYCAATDFIKWNESFAVIFGHNNVMMKREDIGEKYVDKRLYTYAYNTRCNTLPSMLWAVLFIYVSK